MRLFSALEKNKHVYFLIGASFLFFLLRLPSLSEPYWYGDEGVYDVVGMAIRQGRLLYRDIWDNKPPFLYLLYALFQSDQFTIRFVSLIFGLLSFFFFFLIAKKLFVKRKTVYLSSLVFIVLLATPLLEGNIANAENFMMLPILIGAFLVLKYSEIKKPLLLYFAGLLLSFAFLFKVVAVFDAGAFFIFLFFETYRKKKFILNQITGLTPFILSFLTPVIAVILFFIFKGAFSFFASAVLFQNIGYVAYANKFIISQGLLIAKTAALLVFMLFLFKKRKSISKNTLFIFLWFGFSLFNAFFSQRIWAHYLLVLMPSFVLLFFSAFVEKQIFSKRLAQVLTIVTIVFVLGYFPLYTKIFGYYGNFLMFLTHKESVYSYRSFFDKNTPADYALADYIKTKDPNASIFIFGNDPQVYKLLDKLPPGRFIVEYHMLARPRYIKETQDSLQLVKPKYFISTTNDNIPFNMSGYEPLLKIDGKAIYERAF
ncbi:glycosyltransferase family 39 protein [Patescibacteria group bacterium]|nr:glycosyltransferase family 39 protein [Patescibacteria group bacterium]MCL5010058.1 glycosyltransferase family 39 protein [Patescibacteria group bacterium]